MRVGVDITSTRTGHNGIARYVRSVLEALEASTGCKIIRLRGLGLIETAVFPPAHHGYTALADAAPQSALPRVFDSLVRNSVSVIQARPSTFWGPAHRLPLYLPASVRSVLTVHDLCWLHAPETMRRSTRVLDQLLMTSALERVDAVLAVSNSVAAELISAFPALEGRVSVTHLAAALPRLSLDLTADWISSESYFLFVGTFEPRKNLNSLLAAYAKAGRGDDEWPGLVLCGQAGWGGIDPLSEARRLGIGAKVRLVTDVSETQLAVLYAKALCLVMPSIYEGFGLPLIEAMSQGRPVVTSKVAAMPEGVGDAGILINPRSIDSIAEGLRVMARDATLRERLASRAVVRASDFSWHKTAVKTWDVLMGVSS